MMRSVRDELRGLKSAGSPLQMVLAVIGVLIVIGYGVVYGFVYGGVSGALTGLVAAVGISGALAIANPEPEPGTGTGIAVRRANRSAQRIGGAVAAIGCGAGAFFGGWRFGWAWGIAGCAIGVFAALVLRAFKGGQREVRAEAITEGVGQAHIPSRVDPDDATHVQTIDELRQKSSASPVNVPSGFGCDACRAIPLSLQELKKTLKYVRTYSENSHDHYFLLRCNSCGQYFLEEYFEVINFDGGDDDSWLWWIPLSEEEQQSLELRFPNDRTARKDLDIFRKLMHSRSRLTWFPGDVYAWRDTEVMASDSLPL